MSDVPQVQNETQLETPAPPRPAQDSDRPLVHWDWPPKPICPKPHPCIVVQEAKRLGIYSCPSVAYRSMFGHPVGAQVVRLRDAALLAVRVQELKV